MAEQRTRGLRDGDDQAFSPREVEKLMRAQEELQFLLDRGYPLKSANSFVANHHQLTVRQALAVMRSTAPSQSLAARKTKQLAPDELAGRVLHIDGFNQIIGLEVALSDGVLLKGQDGCIRDLAELRGTYRLIGQTREAIRILREVATVLHVSGVSILLDEPVSNSGRLKAAVFEEVWPVDIDVQVVRNPDTLLKRKECVATGDYVILDECGSWFNLLAYAVETRGELRKLTRLVSLGHETAAGRG